MELLMLAWSDHFLLYYLESPLKVLLSLFVSIQSSSQF